MGCDIHMHFEYHSSFYLNKKDEWYNGDYFTQSRVKHGGYRFIDLYPNRDYCLFGVLAGVRNNDYECIDHPRGLPEDASEFVRLDYECWGLDAHSCSYLTLGEILYFAEEHEEEAEILEDLIRRIKQRADELNLIYNFEWSGHNSNQALENANKIRIVFWFDN